MTAFSMNVELNKTFILINRFGFTNSGQIKTFPLGQSMSHQNLKCLPLLPCLLGFSDIFICEAPLYWLLCHHFTPGAKQAWSALPACQHSGDEGVGQVMCCWVNSSWRGLHRHIIVYSFSVWASDSCCQQITKNMGHVTKQQGHCCLVPHHCDICDMARYWLLFFFFSLKRMNTKTINWAQTKQKCEYNAVPGITIKPSSLENYKLPAVLLSRIPFSLLLCLQKKRVVLCQLTMTKVLILLIFLIF